MKLPLLFAVLLILAAPRCCSQNTSSDGTSSPSAATTTAQPPLLQGNFFQRLGAMYAADWKPSAASFSPAPARRALDAPLDSPPFPSSDWGYGGSPAIGVPDGNVYPLMTALKLENSRTKIYGWIAPSFNVSSSSLMNFPLSYDVFPNSVVLNQAVIYVERLPNTVQNNHFDFGYHFTVLFGNDYRFTAAKGYFSQQLLQKNRRYGFDPVLEYADLYFPVKEGLDIRIGRFLSVPGIEAQLAPDNYNMTHSLLYSIDPSTDTGIIGTLKLTKQWIVQLGLSAGHDVAPWSDDRKLSGIACLDYSTPSNRDNFYACANGINDGKYAYNNLQDYDATWYHRFNAKWHIATEAWYMYERQVPNVAGNVANPILPEIGANGAFCRAGQQSCTAPEYAVVNYVNREINSKLMIGFRSDFLDDKKGQRTGVATKYTENTLYATKYFGSTVLVRPEIRFDHSWDRRGYDNGAARSQVLVGADLIYKF
ncbi:MAG: outer membrane beta-barrel protein [Acidobacteriaceae bacterium]